MIRRYSLSLCALAFLSSYFCFAQPAGLKIGSKSSWIKQFDYDASARPASSEAASSFFLLYDEQENCLAQEDYHHYAYTILTSEGIQAMSDLSVTFDPAYQQIIFHEVKIRRGDQVIDQLSKNINVIQREQSMDRYLYDGSKTAVINLRDIRVGDIIEYSFTRKGSNPVHEGHVARTFTFDVYESVDRYFKRIVLPTSRNFTFKNLGTHSVEPEITRTDKATDYSWTFTKLKATSYDNNTPSWFFNVKGVMISDFGSWKEVGDWARKLFKISDADRKRIHEVASTFGEKADDQYILNVIRFVQDEVRYLGFETGINSHKPHPPLQVYEQRFGDCKDKSLLLTSLLNARGIESYPMLVNTSWKHAIDEQLPAGNIFDHCVVQIIWQGKEIYIDPTISNQGGTLDTYFFPSYMRGLVVDNDITALTELPESAKPSTSEMQTIEALTIGGEATLEVRTMYTGSNADNQRGEFARTPLESIQKDYRAYYANLYPDIAQWEDLTFTDNRESNVFTVVEKYKIPTFWKPFPDEEGKIYCSTQPQSISHYFDIPKNIQQRTSPYYLTYPVDFTHTITVKLPEKWTITPVDKVIENDFYQYEYSMKADGNEVTRLTHYMTKKDHVPVEELSSFVTDHAAMYDNLVSELTYDKNIAAASDNTWAGISLTIISLLAGGVLVFFLYNRYDPAPARYMTHGTPIGGWLILIGIGVVFTPFRLLYDFSTTSDLLTGSGWLTMLAAKQYALAAFVIFTQVYNLVFLLLSVLIIVLFFQRRSSFPRLIMIQLASNAALLLIDSIVLNVAGDNPSPSDYDQAVRPIISALIWVPYLHLSHRVKETFVIRGPLHDDEDDLHHKNELVYKHENPPAVTNYQ
ncbi:MAG TPA: DUF3857 domain-containing protein [Chryseosolibacter sp.]